MKKSTDLDLHCLLFSMQICINLTWIKKSDWLTIGSGCVILIYSARQWLKCTIFTERIGTAEANGVNSDHMLHNVASDLNLHCLLLIQQVLETSASSKMDLIEF